MRSTPKDVVSLQGWSVFDWEPSFVKETTQTLSHAGPEQRLWGQHDSVCTAQRRLGAQIKEDDCESRKAPSLDAVL
jgi:hypothetical protein